MDRQPIRWRAHVNFGDGWHWIGNMAPPDDEPVNPDPETTLPPERKEPPAIEWVPITERTQRIARTLIDSVFGANEGEGE